MKATCNEVNLLINIKIDLEIGNYFVQIGKKIEYLPLGQGPLNWWLSF